ncbi:hypothetical protein TNCV_556961 [Trichonephila clavipes]|uniref:Uncharacterized protein n=1 Tax=Trichonephila clavipes TaxID=2585209 RepID=A0A8X6RTG9_TRICX|nr:hypothetical protein TNCV_556961 [Trichonephila clavipes]
MRSRRSSSGAGVVSERRMPQLYSACNRHILVALLLRSPSYPPVNQSERYAAMTSPPVARARLGGKGGSAPPLPPTHIPLPPVVVHLLRVGRGWGGRRKERNIKTLAFPVFMRMCFKAYAFMIVRSPKAREIRHSDSHNSQSLARDHEPTSLAFAKVSPSAIRVYTYPTTVTNVQVNSACQLVLN